MLDPMGHLTISPGASEMNQSLFSTVVSRPGIARDRKRDVGVRLVDSALRHGNGDIAADRAARFDPILGDTKQFALGRFTIDHETALERMARALYVGEQRSEQTAGAAFGGHDLQLSVAACTQKGLRSLFDC